MPAAELLMIALRDRFGDYAVARDTLLSVGLSQRQARRLWQGQGPIPAGIISRLVPLLPEAAAALAGAGEPSVLEALLAIEPVHAREFWVTDQGVDLAETGLDAWAAWHLGHDPENYRTDLVQLLLRTHGYIAVVQTGDGPVLIDWSESSVDPAALRHLRRALVGWGAPPEGYRFGSDVARRPILTLRDAIRHIDQALARQSGGGPGDVQIEAEPLPLTAATPRLQAALNLWRDVGSSPRGLAAYPRDVLAHAVVYHVTEQGLVTADETLVDHLRSLRLLYADPLAAVAKGASAHSSSTMARTIQGRIQMMLGFWTDPDWRKRGLASRACHLAMMMGMAQRQPDWTIGFVDDSSSTRLTWRDRKTGKDGYLWRHREPEVEIRCPYIGTITEDLVAMTRPQLEAEIIGYRPERPIVTPVLGYPVAAE